MLAFAADPLPSGMRHVDTAAARFACPAVFAICVQSLKLVFEVDCTMHAVPTLSCMPSMHDMLVQQ